MCNTESYICLEVATAITAIVGVILSCISLWKDYRLNKKHQKDNLYKELSEILDIAVQYPYLEHQPFIDRWLEFRDKDDERYLRYDLFCNRLFNFFVRLYDFYEGDKKKIEQFCDIKTWIRMHKLNWLNPVDPHENIDGYSEEYRNFINSYITA